MSLKETRDAYGLSQIDAATLVGVPVRTYRRYESDENYGSPFKRQAFISLIKDKCEITEDKGLLSIEKIKQTLLPILKEHNIEFCYLFGSYAKGTATEKSDVDLLIDTDLTGFHYYGLVEEIRTALHKKIDLLRLKDLQNDNPIVIEILKNGIRLLWLVKRI